MAKIDWSMTEEGDLVLGAPKVDASNNTLYYHDDESIDIYEFKDGRAGKKICDLAYTIGRDAWKQIIFNRLKTDAPDWFHHPKMGGNLTDFIGELNTRETGNLGAEAITTALTYAGLLTADQVNVRPVPINAEEIMFFITINIDDSEPYRLPIVFNLNSGLKEV
jgi:hypothetical protein